MAAFTDLDDLVNKASGGNSGTPETVFAYKTPLVGTNTVTETWNGGWWDMWAFRGTPRSGTVPGTVAAPTGATAGAVQGITNAGGTREKFLTQVAFNSATDFHLLVYDRLLHIGGLNLSLTSAQTVGGTLTRNTGGEGNRIWLVHNGATGTGSNPNVTASYTNQDGTASRTTEAVDWNANAGSFPSEQITELPLQLGDTGVQAVASVTLASSITGGNDFSVVVAKPLVSMVTRSGRGLFDSGYPLIEDDACIAFALWPIAFSHEHPILVGMTFVES